MKRGAGFTLIELAVVIFLIGLIVTMGLGALKAQMLNSAIRATLGNEASIKDALMAYLAKNKRLPCPATDAQGAEGRDMTVQPLNCKTYYGLVPYAEIGLTKSTAMDGWDDLLAYGVSPRWTATYNPAPPDNKSSSDPSKSFNVGAPGAINVYDIDQPNNKDIKIMDVAAGSGAAAIVISQGPNGYGAYTVKGTQNDAAVAGASETANIPLPASPPPAYYKRDYTSNTGAYGGAFDDVVMAISPSDLLTPLVRDGALQSAQGQWADQVANIRNYIIGQAPSTCGIASSLPSQYQIDPWGNYFVSPPNAGNFVYKPYTSQLNNAAVSANSAVAATPAFVISNSSANQTVNGPTLGSMFANNPALQTQCP